MSYSFNPHGEVEKFYNKNIKGVSDVNKIYTKSLDYFASLNYLDEDTIEKQLGHYLNSLYKTIPEQAEKQGYNDFLKSGDAQQRQIANKFYARKYKDSFIESGRRLNLTSLSNGLEFEKQKYYGETGDEKKANAPVMATFGPTDAEEPDLEHGLLEGVDTPLDELKDEALRFNCQHDIIFYDDEYIPDNFSIYK